MNIADHNHVCYKQQDGFILVAEHPVPLVRREYYVLSERNDRSSRTMRSYERTPVGAALCQLDLADGFKTCTGHDVYMVHRLRYKIVTYSLHGCFYYIACERQRA